MDKQDITKFKSQLDEKRKKLVGGLDHIERDMLNKSQRDAAGDLSGYSFHMADQATDNFDTELNFGIASNEQQRLNEIDDALKRIEEGIFGICEECEKPIAMKRLKAMPSARYCIKCQEIVEGREKTSGES